MPLSVGTKLGPYEILASLGAGGMGEVYRGRDTKLDREVAVKVLPHVLARDPERLARFEREAKVLASLNHPNIAQIYGVQEAEGYDALVMELVPGQTLAARIKTGAIPLDESLRLSAQIVDALSVAHEKGITHRDLKPANIMITPDGVVKVLDFGLAAMAPASGDASGATNSPTVTMSPASAGMIMGTAPYMSPEQARGNPADRRSDIFSFGVVLYEMLTGRQLFHGETVSDILASVLKDEPNLDGVPEPVRPLLKRCLEKDPKKRLQAIGDWDLLLESGAGSQPAAVSQGARRKPVAWMAAAVIAIAAAAWTSWIAYRATRHIEKPLMRLSVDLGPEAVAGVRATVAISSGATRIVFPVRQDGRQLLATRLLDQPTVTPLEGTEGGEQPFFSPDGQWVAFFAEGKLKKISVTGGAAVTLCDAPRGLGGSWGEDGNIIAALNLVGSLSRVPATGGECHPLTKSTSRQYTERWPQILPGGKAVIFMSAPTPTGLDDAKIEVESLQTAEKKTLWHGGYFGRYLPTNGSTGHLTYIHQGTLFSVPFDPARLEIQGTPAPVLDDVAANVAAAGGQFDFSATGTFVYLSGRIASGAYPLMWLDSSGRMEPLISKPGFYYTPRISPDGQRIALTVATGTGRDIWVYDLQRDSMTRLTFTGKASQWPVWTPDGKHIVFWSIIPSGNSLSWIRADGAGETSSLLESEHDIRPYSFSPDGRRLAYYEVNAQSDTDLWTLPLDLSEPEHPRPGKPEPFLRTPFSELVPVFSPDGRWIAYYANESGTEEVYVRPFPGPGGKWQISTGGGRNPVWSRSGLELFYETADNRIMVAEYTAKGDSFAAGKPRLWSDKQIYDSGSSHADLAPDGKRFAVFPRAETTDENKGSLHVTFLLNFFDELRRKVPVGK